MFSITGAQASLLLIHRLLDELLSVYIVFRTPLLEDTALKSYLDRLAVNLDVFAFGTAPGPDQEAKSLPKELIHSETIKDSNEPTIVLHESDDATHAYVFWKIEVPIGEFPHLAVFELTLCSSTPREIPQASHLLSTHSFSEAGCHSQEARLPR